MRSINRSIHNCRLRHWLRAVCEETRMTSGNAATARATVAAGPCKSAALTSSTTFVDTLLTFWPPAPPARAKVHLMASPGTTTPRTVRMSSLLMVAPRNSIGNNRGVEIFETPLPGIGVRYEFDTDRGRRLGVLVYRDGHRDVLVYREDDVDACSETLQLSVPEAASLVELLGGTKITERLSDLRHEVQGLAIEWVVVEADSPLAGRTIGDGKIRTQSGASVVAILRGGASFPGPGPDFTLQAGDTALVIGGVEGVAAAHKIIAG
jgi:TrkA domain protein